MKFFERSGLARDLLAKVPVPLLDARPQYVLTVNYSVILPAASCP